MTEFVSPRELATALGLPQPTAEQAVGVTGAGAGKTETMAARVLGLVANGVVAPDRVLGLTFTRKAARQLADRVRARLRRLAGARARAEGDPRVQARGRAPGADRADLSRLRRPACRGTRPAAAGRTGCPPTDRDRVVAVGAPGGRDVDRGPGHRPRARDDHQVRPVARRGACRAPCAARPAARAR